MKFAKWPKFKMERCDKPTQNLSIGRMSCGIFEIYESNFLKILIEEDIIGFYLIVYNDPHSEKSSEDYLVDSLEEAFQEAKERFGISNEQWKLQNQK